MPESPSPPAKTLEAVARAAGVSRMTVSRVLRQPERVSQETRDRVKRCIEALGYRPNPMVSVLMSATRQRRAAETGADFAFLIPVPAASLVGNPLFGGIFQGASERAAAKGYSVSLYSTVDEGARRNRLAEVLQARGTVGVIVGPLASSRGRLAFPLDRFACVACGFSLLKPELHRVATNQWEVSAKVFRRAFRKGYRRIGLAITDRSARRVDHYWHSAFLYHQQKLPSKNRVPVLLHGSGDLAGFERWIGRWKPDCVIASHTKHLQWLEKLGLHAPADLGFAVLSASSESMAISGAARDFYSIGSVAVDMLSVQLHDNERGIPQRRQTVLIDPAWVEGTTL